LVIFRQDMRIDDNTALMTAVRRCSHLSYLFILDTTILARGPARDPRIMFVLDALKNLEKAIEERGGTLSVMYGDPVECVTRFLTHYPCDHLFRNQSYGP
jgi:deoxyribodipyrimidine photo-lyase